MNLKEHNDIVQKLLGEITNKQTQIKQLNKKIMKMSKQSSTSHVPKLEQSQTEKNLNKKIIQLTKQHKDRIGQLTQQLRSKSVQNKQLKQRLSIKNSLQSKQKQRIVEVMKKTIHNGVNNQYDHKIAALVSHYEQQIQKKEKFIQTLKRQIKSLSLSQGNKKQSQIDTKENIESENSSVEVLQKNTISILTHKDEVAKLNKEIQKLKKLYESKQSEYKSMSKKYADLTKQYYRILNEYGVDQPTAFSKTKSKFTDHKLNNKVNQNKSSQLNTFTSQSKQSKVSNWSKEIKKQNLLGNLLQQMVQDQQNSVCDSSISVTFQQNFKKFNNRPKIMNKNSNENQYGEEQSLNFQHLLQQEEHDESQQNKGGILNKTKQIGQTEFQNLITEIKQILNLQDINDIVPYLHNLIIKKKQIQLYDAITRSLHSFFYKFGMGKVSKTDLIQTLQCFELKVNKYIQNSELLDELCIEVGSKRQHLKDKILELKQIHNQYLTNMRNIAYIKQLHKSNKVMEFIQFFQLDTSDLLLPQQLKNIYQQLKYVDKFLKLANTILSFQGNGIQEGLDNILNKLQKYETYKEIAQKKLKKKQVNANK